MKYYYEKYEIVPVYKYIPIETYVARTTAQRKQGYLEYTINQNNGKLILIGSSKMHEVMAERLTVYALYDFAAGAAGVEFDSLFRFSPGYSGAVQYKITTSHQLSHNDKGRLLETLIAEEGTYPDNGIQNGFWYVKTKKAISSQIKIDGVVRDIVGYELKGYGAVSLQFKDDKGIIHDI